MVNMPWEQHRERIEEIQKTPHSWWGKEKSHILSQRSTADHLADLGAEEEKRQLVVDRDERRGVASGTAAPEKTGGGCGIAIKGVNRDRWITVSKMAVWYSS